MATKAQDYQSKLNSQKKFRVVAHQFTKKVFHWPYILLYIVLHATY